MKAADPDCSTTYLHMTHATEPRTTKTEDFSTRSKKSRRSRSSKRSKSAKKHSSSARRPEVSDWVIDHRKSKIVNITTDGRTSRRRKRRRLDRSHSHSVKRTDLKGSRIVNGQPQVEEKQALNESGVRKHPRKDVFY